jgi:hypothetical protein
MESEWLTRKRRIDPLLDATGWPVRRGRGNAARGLAHSDFDFDGVRCPFLYATNGEVIWFHDVRHERNRSRRVKAFHTAGALRELLERDNEAALDKLRQMPHDHPLLRPYQLEANAGVEKAIAERKRNLLVAMATGTGKTYTLVNQIYRLVKAGVAKRVLFLVDRRALAAQAVRAFNSLDAEPNLKFTKVYEVAGAVHLARDPRPLRRHQDRPHGHPGRPHGRLLHAQGLRLRLRAGGERRPPRRLRRRERPLRGPDERRLPERG